MGAIYRVQARAKVEFVPVVPAIDFAGVRARLAAWQDELGKPEGRDFNLVETLAQDLAMLLRIAEARGLPLGQRAQATAKLAAWTANPSLSNYPALFTLVAETIALVNQLDR